MVIEGDDAESIDTGLTKGNVAPPAVDLSHSDDDMSNLTGNTRESNVKAYAAEKSKKVASQYIYTIDAMKKEH